MLRQQTRDIGLHALFQLGRQRQPPIVEQMVVDTRRTMLGASAVADQQDLPTLLQTFELAFSKAILDASGVPAEKAICLAMQP